MCPRQQLNIRTPNLLWCSNHPILVGNLPSSHNSGSTYMLSGGASGPPMISPCENKFAPLCPNNCPIYRLSYRPLEVTMSLILIARPRVITYVDRVINRCTQLFQGAWPLSLTMFDCLLLPSTTSRPTNTTLIRVPFKNHRSRTVVSNKPLEKVLPLSWIPVILVHNLIITINNYQLIHAKKILINKH